MAGSLGTQRAHLFVGGQDERHRDPGIDGVAHRGQRGHQPRLHVGGAPADQSSVVDLCPERRIGPGLQRPGGHRVDVAAERQPGRPRRGVVGQHRPRVWPRQVGFDAHTGLPAANRRQTEFHGSALRCGIPEIVCSTTSSASKSGRPTAPCYPHQRCRPRRRQGRRCAFMSSRCRAGNSLRLCLVA